MTDEDVYPPPYQGHAVLRVSAPKTTKDAKFNSYLLEDGGDGYPAIGLSTNIASTWYRVLLPYSAIYKAMETIEREIDRQRGERAEVPARG